MKESETKTQSGKGVKVLKTVLNTLINILIVIVLVISVSIAVLSLTSKANGGMSTILGYTIENIQTDSMKGGSEDYDGGDFETGDIIIGKFTDYLYTEEYEVGDIITYRGDIDGNPETLENICHRIIEVAYDSGTRCYRTKGDYNSVADQEKDDLSAYLRAGDIGSVFYSRDYQGKIIKGFGNVLTFLQTKFGFFLCVLLPMIIFFMYELIRVVFNAAYYRREKEQEEKDASDAEKKAEIDAAVAAALAAKEAENPDGTPSASAGAPVDMTPEQLEQFKQFMEFQKMQQASKDADEDNKE